MNPWLINIDVKPPEKRTRTYKKIYAEGKPCARCNERKRVYKSYCRECHNANSRATTKKIYDRKKMEEQGLKELHYE